MSRKPRCPRPSVQIGGEREDNVAPGRPADGDSSGLKKSIVHSELAQESKESTVSDEEDLSSECAICLQSWIHPVQLPCTHIFCYLCVKGSANQSKRCALCRSEIPVDYLHNPKLVNTDQPVQPVLHDGQYHWFYEGKRGWWMYDDRASSEIEERFKKKDKMFEILIAGFLYVVDLEHKFQFRRNDPTRRRQIKRDVISIPDSKGIAGLRRPRVEMLRVRKDGDGGEMGQQQAQPNTRQPQPTQACPLHTAGAAAQSVTGSVAASGPAPPLPPRQPVQKPHAVPLPISGRPFTRSMSSSQTTSGRSSDSTRLSTVSNRLSGGTARPLADSSRASLSPPQHRGHMNSGANYQRRQQRHAIDTNDAVHQLQASSAQLQGNVLAPDAPRRSGTGSQTTVDSDGRNQAVLLDQPMLVSQDLIHGSRRVRDTSSQMLSDNIGGSNSLIPSALQQMPTDNGAERMATSRTNAPDVLPGRAVAVVSPQAGISQALSELALSSDNDADSNDDNNNTYDDDDDGNYLPQRRPGPSGRAEDSDEGNDDPGSDDSEVY